MTTLMLPAPSRSLQLEQRGITKKWTKVWAEITDAGVLHLNDGGGRADARATVARQRWSRLSTLTTTQRAPRSYDLASLGGIPRRSETIVALAIPTPATLADPSRAEFVEYRVKCESDGEAMRWHDALVQWRLRAKKERVKKRGTLSPAAAAQMETTLAAVLDEDGAHEPPSSPQLLDVVERARVMARLDAEGLSDSAEEEAPDSKPSAEPPVHVNPTASDGFFQAAEAREAREKSRSRPTRVARMFRRAPPRETDGYEPADAPAPVASAAPPAEPAAARTAAAPPSSRISLLEDVRVIRDEDLKGHPTYSVHVRDASSEWTASNRRFKQFRAVADMLKRAPSATHVMQALPAFPKTLGRSSIGVKLSRRQLETRASGLGAWLRALLIEQREHLEGLPLEVRSKLAVLIGIEANVREGVEEADEAEESE